MYPQHSGDEGRDAGFPEPEPRGGDASDTMAVIVYVLYLAALLVGGITALIGVVVAYVARGDAPDWLDSHYRFQIRTFWISLVYGLVGGVLSLIVIGWFVLLFLLIWWIVRCAKGLLALRRGEPIRDVTTWLW
jgi:uncharacterized membrane protein